MEYMAARMDDLITASQRWHEEAFEDALRAIHTNPELSKSYAFMYSGCVYESAAAVVSMHWTKAGAYRAMNRYLFDRWQEHNTDPYRKKYTGRGTKVIDTRFQWWGIKEFAILP